jgi:hypothetical protein
MTETRGEEEFITHLASEDHEAPDGSPGRVLTEARMLERLRAEVAAAGFQKDWAEAHRISPQLLCDTLQEKRAIRGLVASAMGYRMIIRFEPDDEGMTIRFEPGDKEK